MSPSLTRFSSTVKPEGAFTVLAAARRVAAAGKDVIELEIGDSPFPSPDAAVDAGIEAIRAGRTTYGPSGGLPELRAAAAAYVNREHGLSVTADHVIAGPGAKTFEQLFCDAFVEPDDGVLVFSPYFPTYAANIGRRGARMVLSNLRASRAFRPNLDDVRRFLDEDPRPKAIFLNSPHNPTGGVATEDDLRGLADLVRGRNVAVFADEPYDCMVWEGRHRSLLAQPGMLEQTVAAYTFSKSFSMSGWRASATRCRARRPSRSSTCSRTWRSRACPRSRSSPGPPPSSAAGSTATSGCATSTARSSCWWPA
jgi:aspartate aminotransferase